GIVGGTAIGAAVGEDGSPGWVPTAVSPQGPMPVRSLGNLLSEQDRIGSTVLKRGRDIGVARSIVSGCGIATGGLVAKRRIAEHLEIGGIAACGPVALTETVAKRGVARTRVGLDDRAMADAGAGCLQVERHSEGVVHVLLLDERQQGHEDLNI